MDNDLSAFLCEGLQCESFLLRINTDNDFDYYLEEEQRWIGGLGEVIKGTATFKVGFYTPSVEGYHVTSYSTHAYFNEIGFSISYPAPDVSIFNVVRIFE